MNHKETNIEQFTLQAEHFPEMTGHNEEEALTLLKNAVSLTSADNVLDVACGSGIVASAFATIAAHVTGIDITPAMLEQAAKVATKRGLTNVSWQQGDIETLPFENATFSVVLSRYAFHHFLAPQRVLSEMLRVCKPGGRVMIADAVLPDEKVEEYNRFEKLMDPSHAGALSFAALDVLMAGSGLKNVKTYFYRMEMELERQLSISFPLPGDDAKIREMLRADVGNDRIGIQARELDGSIHYSYPVTVIAGEKLS